MRVDPIFGVSIEKHKGTKVRMVGVSDMSIVYICIRYIHGDPGSIVPGETIIQFAIDRAIVDEMSKQLSQVVKKTTDLNSRIASGSIASNSLYTVEYVLVYDRDKDSIYFAVKKEGQGDEDLQILSKKKKDFKKILKTIHKFTKKGETADRIDQEVFDMMLKEAYDEQD